MRKYFFSPIPEQVQEEPPNRSPTPPKPVVSFDPVVESTERRDYKTLWRWAYGKTCKETLGLEVGFLSIIPPFKDDRQQTINLLGYSIFRRCQTCKSSFLTCFDSIHFLETVIQFCLSKTSLSSPLCLASSSFKLDNKNGGKRNSSECVFEVLQSDYFSLSLSNVSLFFHFCFQGKK